MDSSRMSLLFNNRYFRISFVVTFLLIILAFLFPLLPKNKPPQITPASKKSQYQYQTSNQIFAAQLGSKKDNTPTVSFSSKSGSSVDFSLIDAKPDSVSQSSNTVIFKNVLPNTDLSYTTLVNGLKEEIILNRPGAQLEYNFSLFTNNTQPAFENGHYSRYFYDKQNKYQFHIEKPYAIDARGNRTNEINLSITKSKDSSNRYQISLLLPQDWLNDENRAYPVRVDPTFVYDTTSDFVAGTLNRLKNTGSANSPTLETNFQELVSDRNTLAIFHFNEPSDNYCNEAGVIDLCDSSGNVYSGTATGTTITTTGQRLGSAARTFNGTSDYITLAESNHFSINSFTVESWVNESSDTAATRFIIDNQDGATDGWSQEISSADLFVCKYNSSTVTGDTVVQINTWYHVACVSDGSILYLYVDGVLEDSAVISGSIAEIIPARIGARSYTSAANYFPGTIDEVQISSTAKTELEIHSDASRRPYGIYTSDVIDLGGASNVWNPLTWSELGVRTDDGETVFSTTGLIAQWKLNETSGTTAANNGGSCGSACNGTLTNFASTGSQDAAVLTGWTSNNRRWGAGALMFDGSNDEVICTDANCGGTTQLDLGSRSWTVAAWIKTSINTRQIIVRKGNNANNFSYSLETGDGSDGKPDFILYNNGTSATAYMQASSNTPINDDLWHYLVGTYDGTTIKIYVDGILDASSTTKTGTLTTNSADNFSIGSEAGEIYHFIGVIDSVSIYGRSLDLPEIINNYQSSNIEFQTRVGSTLTADDNSWEAWKPTSVETTIDDFNNPLNIATPSATIHNGALISTSSASLPSISGTSLKTKFGQVTSLTNVVALWHLDETGGTGAYLKDSSGNNNHATPVSSYVTSGVNGRARTFRLVPSDGYGYLTVGALTGGTAVKSIDFWYYTVGGNAIIDLDGSTHYIWDNGGTITATGFTSPTIYVNGVVSSAVVNNKWQHIAVTTGTSFNASNTTIGKESTNYLSGKLDEIRVSSVTLSPEEIAETYRLGRDYYLSETLSSTDLSSATTIPFYIAADKAGTYLSATLGESNFSNYLPDANTTGFWHLDETLSTSGSIKDDSGNSRHGTPTGTTTINGKIGKALTFTANDDINLGSQSILDSQANFTIDAWVFPTAQTGSTSFLVFSEEKVAKVGQYGNQARFLLGNGSAWSVTDNTGGTIPLKKWSHIAWVKSGVNYYIYINGVLTKSAATAPATVGTSSNINYISTYDGTNETWNGGLDEIRISNSVRTADEIRQAYEVGLRSHPITIDFASAISHADPVLDASDLEFKLMATTSGTTNHGDNIFKGDKIIIKENYNGTEYLAQGTVNSVDPVTGGTTVSSWDNGSTFPSVGYTPEAVVFKWQKEFWDITKPLDSHLNTVTNFVLRNNLGSQATNIWIDDLKSSSGYLTSPTNSTIDSSLNNRYFQFRTIFTSSDTFQTATVSAVTLSPLTNVPEAPTIGTGSPQSATSIRWSFTDNDTDEIGFRIFDTDNNLTFTCAAANISYCDETGLIPNTSYTRKVAGYNANGNGTYSSTTSAISYAAIPSAPSVSNRTNSSIDVAIASDTNPSTTLYALYKETGTTCDGVGGNYISESGAEAGGTATWLTKTNWGTKSILNINKETLYAFCAKAKNSDGVETAFGSTATNNVGYSAFNATSIIYTNANGQNVSLGAKYTEGNRANRYISGLDNGINDNDANTTTITIQSGILTLNSNETLVAGSLIFSGGSLAIVDGAEIRPGAPIWIKDADADGYPENDTMWFGVGNKPAGGRRKGNFTSVLTLDCNENNYDLSNTCTIANGSNCSSDAICTSGICGTNLDGDNYFSLVAGHTGTCQATAKAYTDCYDANPATTDAELVYPGSTTCSATNRGDGSSYDYNCDGNSTPCSPIYQTVTTGSQSNYNGCRYEDVSGSYYCKGLGSRTKYTFSGSTACGASNATCIASGSYATTCKTDKWGECAGAGNYLDTCTAYSTGNQTCN